MAFPATEPPPLPKAVRSRPDLIRRIGYTPPPLAPLDVAGLAALGSLPLRARRLADALGTGGHTSRRKGASIEFADYRDYQPGDELRRVDWRLYARTDRLHIREAHEETPLRVVLLLDASPSMAYRGPGAPMSKLDYARMLLGALALVVRRQRDACGAGLLAEDLLRWLPPTRSPSRLQNVWALIDTPAEGAGTALADTLTQALEAAPRRCLFVLASDFYEDPERLAPVLGRLHYERHDFLALHVADPIEIDFPFDDPSVFVDLETGDDLLLDPAATAASYREKFAAHRRAVADLCAGHGFNALSLRTDEPPLDALRAYLALRAGQHAR